MSSDSLPQQPSELDLNEQLESVLTLQANWSKDNTAHMAERGMLVRDRIPASIRRMLNDLEVTASETDVKFAVEGRDGTGLKTRVPWVRVYSREFSPNATKGWYVVYLFAFDGSAVYLSLNQGTTVPGNFKKRSAEELGDRVRRAREQLGHLDRQTRLQTNIHLADEKLGRSYEIGNVLAIPYPTSEIPPAEQLQDDLGYMLTLLSTIYRSSLGFDDQLTNADELSSHPSTSDPAAFIEWAKEWYGENLVHSRRAAEQAARELLQTKAGAMSPDDARELGRLFNSGSWAGVARYNRFSPAFSGATMNRLIDPIDNFNDWTNRLWREPEEEALLAAGDIWEQSGLRGAGPSYPSMILYLRNPDRFAVWLNGPGLEALADFNSGRSKAGRVADYKNFCEAVRRFRSIHSLASEEVDAVLSLAARAAKSEMSADAIVGDELSDTTTHGESAVDMRPVQQRSIKTLADSVYLEVDVLDEWIELLAEPNRRQALLYGPPGTGKTFVASRLARFMAADDNRVSLIQFHPSFSYEDFIEGLRPVTRGKDGQTSTGSVEFAVVDGVFKNFCTAAAGAPSETHVLVIDEINRSDLGSVMGELLHLLEYRGERHQIQLPYSRQMFHVPENVIILGTMNTADRSLALLDFALRRRFHAFEMVPNRAVLQRYLDGREEPSDLVLQFFDLVHSHIGDSDFAPGHSYWMSRDLTVSGLDRIWRYELRPYIKEFWFEQANRLDALDDAVSGLLVEAG